MLWSVSLAIFFFIQRAHGSIEKGSSVNQQHVEDLSQVSVEIDANGDLSSGLQRPHTTRGRSLVRQALQHGNLHPMSEVQIMVPTGGVIASTKQQVSVEKQNSTVVNSDDSRLIMGAFRPWVLAVIISVIGSFSIVTGLVLQKIALKEQLVAKRWWQVGEVVMSPRWLLGFFLGSVMILPLEGAAYYLAPMSLLSPLSGTSVVLNMIVAPRFLGERLNWWPDVSATSLILIGMIITTLTGSHGMDEESALVPVAGLLSKAGSKPFLIAAILLVSALACSGAFMLVRHHVIESTAKMQALNPPILHVVLLAGSAAGTGVFTNLILKAAMDLFRSSAPIHVWGLCVILGVVPMATLQFQLISKGQRLYVQIVFFPVYSALLVIGNTFYGALFYMEYVELMKQSTRLILFCIGVSMVLAGIIGFKFRDLSSMQQDPQKAWAKLLYIRRA